MPRGSGAQTCYGLYHFGEQDDAQVGAYELEGQEVLSDDTLHPEAGYFRA